MTDLIQIPFHDTAIHALSDEGKPLVSLRHACESIDLDYSTQLKKLKAKSWACVVFSPTHDASGRMQEMTMIDRRTMTMWLATIEPSRVKEAARPTLEAFQNEAADALDSYFHEGGAINPNASADQLDTLQRKARFQLEMINLARPSIQDPTFLDSKARLVLARALGEAPEIDPLDVPLYAESFLREHGVMAKEAKSLRSIFGRRVANAYRDHHGVEPHKSENEVNGGIRAINSYTERDRHLFDQVWELYYADVYEPSLMEEIA